MITRSAYPETRFASLSSMIALTDTLGLEFGACDLPTVRPDQGNCRYADFRTTDEMADLWQIPMPDLSPVDYVISRGRPLSRQIRERFDYVIACHVLEHVPDTVGYLNELKAMLKPEAGRLIFLTIPDKRATSDATRPTTTIDHLLMNYYEQSQYPKLENILEFHRHWIGNAEKTGPMSIAEAYTYATEYCESGLADVHCHVWTDDEFRDQLTQLLEANFLPGLALARFEPMTLLNEFTVVLTTTGEESTRLPRRASDQSRSV